MTKSWVRSKGATNAKLNSGRRRSPYSMAKAFRISQTQTYKHKHKQTNNNNKNSVRDRLAESIADVRETKLYVSNLDGRVSDEDIRQLFSAFGELKKCVLHFDRKGVFMGTAEVVYFNGNNAATAWKRYNNVLLDGKPMNGHIVADQKFDLDLKLPLITHPHHNVSKQRGRGKTGFVARAENGFRKRSEGNYRRKKGRGWKGERVRKSSTISATQLDMDLESYYAQANTFA